MRAVLAVFSAVDAALNAVDAAFIANRSSGRSCRRNVVPRVRQQKYVVVAIAQFSKHIIRLESRRPAT